MVAVGFENMSISNENATEHLPHCADRHFECIRLRQGAENGLFLSASNLGGRTWGGNIWYFKNPEDCPNIKCAVAGLDVPYAVTDAQWISDKSLIYSSDAGSIEIWELVEESKNFVLIWKESDHDSVVSSVSVNSDKTLAVSGSDDERVKIWSLESKKLVSTFRGHSDSVLKVQYHPTNPEIFLSVSKDDTVILWDMRKNKPAKRIAKEALPYTPSTLCWVPGKESGFAISDIGGNTIIKDLTNDSTQEIKAHSRPVREMQFCPEDNNILASVAEDSTFVVTDVATNSTIYKSKSHSDFVTGLAWSSEKSKVYTCGWDSKLFLHNFDDLSSTECGCNVPNGVES